MVIFYVQDLEILSVELRVCVVGTKYNFVSKKNAN